MRARFLVASAAFLTAITAVTLTSGQQGTEGQPKAGARNRADLGARLVELRGEVELLRVDQEARRATLLQLLKGLESQELLKETDQSPPIVVWAVQVRALLGESLIADKGLEELVAETMKTGETPEPEKMKRREEALRAAVNRRRDEFLRLTKTLNTKKLELDDLEERYKSVNN